MVKEKDGFAEYLKKEIEKYSGIMVPVKASLAERLMVKKAPVGKLHPNPDDEFSHPEVGPNYRIISKYMALYKQYGSMKKPEEILEEPLLVEKVRPDGYMLLNGHHRWAAFWNLGVKMVPVSIVNLTQETDIEQMIAASTHDKRATLDLDEVVFWQGEGPAEKPLKGLIGRRFKEQIREGIPALLHYLSKNGYDIWVYTAKYYSMDYIREYFRHYTVKVDGIITGTARKTKDNDEAKKRVEHLFSERYAQTLHIDRDMVLRTFADSRAFEDYPVKETGSGWSKAVMSIIRKIEKNEKRNA